MSYHDRGIPAINISSSAKGGAAIGHPPLPIRKPVLTLALVRVLTLISELRLETLGDAVALLLTLVSAIEAVGRYPEEVVGGKAVQLLEEGVEAVCGRRSRVSKWQEVQLAGGLIDSDWGNKTYTLDRSSTSHMRL